MYQTSGATYLSQAPSYSPTPLIGFARPAYGSSGSSKPSKSTAVCHNTCRSVGICTCR